MIPEFAIIGHPNEGKSSVLSTLAEDDSVRVSPIPGETTQCRTFPVIIDGEEIIRFTDTPGFQNPTRVLSELKRFNRMGDEPLSSFRQHAANIEELRDDCELLAPLECGAGIIYVVDGSRPMRNVDRAEMEILRLTGKPRMAIINCKFEQTEFLEQWKNEFRKNFNANRVFNAHHATYVERILLLESLKAIEQDWHELLSRVVDAVKREWQSRNEAAADIIVTLLTDSLSLQLAEQLSNPDDAEKRREKLFGRYQASISAREKQAHQRLRELFRHNRFNYELPPHSLLRSDLFDGRTWQLFGLTRKQLAIAGGLGGAAVGAGLEIAAFGHGLGLFTVASTVAGAIGALWGSDKLSGKLRLPGLGLDAGGEQLTIGPAKSINLLFVLLNRALLYYRYMSTWAHGRRDYETTLLPVVSPSQQEGNDHNNSNGMEETGKEYGGNFTSDWSVTNISTCHSFFRAVTKAAASGESGSAASASDSGAEEKFRKLILSTLYSFSGETDR